MTAVVGLLFALALPLASATDAWVDQMEAGNEAHARWELASAEAAYRAASNSFKASAMAFLSTSTVSPVSAS